MSLQFTSIYSDLNPSCGPALGTRELLELLAAWGMDCRVLCAGVRDNKRGTTREDVLISLRLPAVRFQAELAGGRGLRPQRERRSGGDDAHGVAPGGAAAW